MREKSFNSCVVRVKFASMDQVRLFQEAVKKHDEMYENGDGDVDMPMYASLHLEDENSATISLDVEDYDGIIDALALAKLIVKYFYYSNGTIVVADSYGAGTINIKEGKIDI